MKHPNLDKALQELNKDGEFDFVINGNILYDRNENYHSGYVDDLNCQLAELSEEFGGTFTAITVDAIHDKLEHAWIADGGTGIEWETNVAMSLGASIA